MTKLAGISQLFLDLPMNLKCCNIKKTTFSFYINNINKRHENIRSKILVL